MFGFTVEEASVTVEVWPDNLLSANVFISMSTQWRRAGMSGACVGLDYSVLPEMWRRAKVPPALRDEVFDDLRVMEEAALLQMSKNKKTKG